MVARSMDVRPSPSELRRLLDYDPATGIFTWRFRPELVGTKASGWNTRSAGKKAGQVVDRGYIHISVHGIFYLGHMLAWTMEKGAWPEGPIDHKNKNASDNRMDNLRLATSGVKGVRWRKKAWEISIRANGQDFYYGRTTDFDLAVIIAEEARAKHHGEFARME